MLLYVKHWTAEWRGNELAAECVHEFIGLFWQMAVRKVRRMLRSQADWIVTDVHGQQIPVIDSQSHKYSDQIVFFQIILLRCTEPVTARIRVVDEHAAQWFQSDLLKNASVILIWKRVPVIGLKDFPYEELEPFFGQTAHVQARLTSETDSKLLLEIPLLDRYLQRASVGITLT